jgi:hypothetical protein
MIAKPVTPVRSAITGWICRFIWVRAQGFMHMLDMGASCTHSSLTSHFYSSNACRRIDRIVRGRGRECKLDGIMPPTHALHY